MFFRLLIKKIIKLSFVLSLFIISWEVFASTEKTKIGASVPVPSVQGVTLRDRFTVRFGEIVENQPKLVIRMYFSWGCPHCMDFLANRLDKILEKYVRTHKIVFELSDFPINEREAMAASRICWIDDSFEGCYQRMKNLVKMRQGWDNSTYYEYFQNHHKKYGIDDITYNDHFEPKAYEAFKKELLDHVLKVSKEYDINKVPAFIVHSYPINSKPFLLDSNSNLTDQEIDKLLIKIAQSSQRREKGTNDHAVVNPQKVHPE